MKPATPACAEHADRPKTKLPPSTQLRKVVFGGSLLFSSQRRHPLGTWRSSVLMLGLAACAQRLDEGTT